MLFMYCVCHAFASVHCCLVVTWRERSDLLALIWDFVTFLFGILRQVWYLSVSILNPCCLSYFYIFCILDLQVNVLRYSINLVPNFAS